MNTKLLKQKVLDLAIHGKLVPQDPNDEPASVVLEKIRLEREKTKKHSKGIFNSESYLYKDANGHYWEKCNEGDFKDITSKIPYEIPNNWVWCRLSEITYKIKRGKSPKYVAKSSYLAFAQKCNLKEGGIALWKALYIDEASISRYLQEDYLKYKDIVINSTGTGTMGRVGFFNEKYPTNIKGVFPDSHVTIVRCLEQICSSYIYYMIKNKQSYLEQGGEGSTNQKELKPQTIKELFIPLPPLKEQQRIVEQIEKIYAQIDLLEENQTDLRELITKSKAKILDLAIHGKLVEQDSNDEPASVLLEKIRAEKEERIKKGNLKRDKKESYIIKDEEGNYFDKFYDGTLVDINKEIPYELPIGWCWNRLNNICDFIGGGTPSKGKKEYWNGDINWASVKDIKGKYLNKTLEKITEIGLNQSSASICNPGEAILVTRICPGKVVISNIKTAINQDLKVIKPKLDINIKYLKVYFDNFEKEIIHDASGTTVKGIKLEYLNSMLFPLPPFKEQQRIVEQIEKLFSILDEIKSIVE